MNALETLLHHGGGRSWESPELTSLNRVPASATLARDGALALDGTWDFALVARPEDAPSADTWSAAEVPGLWTMQGFAAPQYTNVKMPFDDLPPTVPDANPTGVYRRRFEVPDEWRDRRVVLHFGGSEGALHVVLNGEPIGIAKDSRTPAEFDVTEHLRHGAENELLVAVVQWSDASFVEDQDQWWHFGLPRSVVLYPTPRAYVADVFARGDMDGRLVVEVRTEGSGEPRAQLIGPDGEAVLDEPARRRPARHPGRGAAPVVGRAAGSLHARGDVRRGPRHLPGRLPQRRGHRPAPTRQRPRRADLRRQSP